MEDELKTNPSLPPIKPQKEIISVEIGENSIKLADVKFFKRRRLFCLATRRLSLKEDAYISQEIANLLASLNISKRDILLNIPRHHVIARVLHLPSTKDDELEEMVQIESVKQIPYAAEEIISDYKLIKKFEDGYSDVLLVIAPIGMINRLIDILKNANLRIEKIAVSSEALFGWYSMGISAFKKDKESNIALINLDGEYIDIDIVEKGGIAFTRAIAYSADKKGIADEIKRSIAKYQKEKKVTIEKMVVSGAANRIDDMTSVLKEEFDIPLEVCDQVKGMELERVLDVDFKETSYVGPIGLSVASQDIKINLLPKHIIEENEIKGLKKVFVTTAVLFVSIIIIFSFTIAKKIMDRTHYKLLLESEIRKLEPEVKIAERTINEDRIIKEEIQKRPLAIEILTEVYRTAPQGISLILLEYESGRSLVLRGEAPSLNDVIRFIGVLENSLYFENAQLKYTTKRTSANRELTDFEIVCILSKHK